MVDFCKGSNEPTGSLKAKKWVSPYQPLKSFHLIKLQNMASWNEVAKSLDVLKAVDSGSSSQIDEDKLVDEIVHVNNIVINKLEK
ncbi:hypothetical protein ANN_21164 [Periplaneta americana]|uniref:Uncharacterized protein n=1 Tax=Periplaneta americana TaxID=6978 RepID=A0ABQ8SFH7_PERAM|nr:hypothetical protein ANN_21164 [Periplaneta americana]